MQRIRHSANLHEHHIKEDIAVKWYRTWDARTHTHYWWTQRDENGVCYEIRPAYGGTDFVLYKCDAKIKNVFNTLQSAMDAATV